MIFKYLAKTGFISGALILLSGCIGDGDNSAQGGLKVHVAEVHVESNAHILAEKPSIIAAGGENITATAETLTADAGYDHANLDHHDIRDKNGRLLSIYRAYVVINNIELVPCFNVAQQAVRIPQLLMNALVPMAAAHSGHGDEPVGGRNLDAPNVIDIITRDEYFLPLGDIAVAPGRYCAARVALVRLANIGYGVPEYDEGTSDSPITEPETPDMTGKIFAIRADYCAAVDGLGACTQRVRVDVDDNGLNEPLLQTIEFEQPLTVSSHYAEAYVALGIAYGEWLSDVDITLLGSDANEQQKMLDNMVHSLHIYQVGLGELPPNIAL